MKHKTRIYWALYTSVSCIVVLNPGRKCFFSKGQCSSLAYGLKQGSSRTRLAPPIPAPFRYIESAQWPIADCTWRELCSYEGLGSGSSKVKAFSPSTWASSFPLKSPGLGAQPRAYILDCLEQVDGWILWNECGQTELDTLVGQRENESRRQRQTSVRLQALYRCLTPVSCVPVAEPRRER